MDGALWKGPSDSWETSLDNQAAGVGTVFITGLSAAGKSTLGKHLYEGLVRSGVENIKLLEGEEIREALAARGRRFGYTTGERSALMFEIVDIIREWHERGFHCIVCTINHVRKTREEVRRRIRNSFEVYLECPVEVCAQRDPKGHYRKAMSGQFDNFVGVTEPFQVSSSVDLVLPTHRYSVVHCSEILLAETLKFFRSLEIASGNGHFPGSGAQPEEGD